MDHLTSLARAWRLPLVGITVLTVLSFLFADVPIAANFMQIGHALSPIGENFGGSVLLFIETAVIISLLILRLITGYLSPLGKTIILACLGSMCTYLINDHVLKVFFGVPGPAVVLHGVRHSMHLLNGSENSSFPSGHMVLAGAFAGVFMRLYKISVVPMSILLGIGAGLLLVGDWHFLSDIAAGTVEGVFAGFLLAEFWVIYREAHELRLKLRNHA